MAGGRPSLYTPELATVICAAVADGDSLRDICDREGMPDRSTVFRWLQAHPEFRDQYALAREQQAILLASEIMQIADDGRNDWMQRHGEDDPGWVANGEHIQRSRLRVDTRKWVLSKVLPKVYGDRLEINAKTTAVPATADDLIREAAGMGITPEQLFGRRPAE